MDPFVMVVLIVLISVGAGVFNSYLKHKNAGPPAAEVEDMRRQMARLEQRVQTLEALATDPTQRLKRDIEALR
jgi:hypothetical protein